MNSYPVNLVLHVQQKVTTCIIHHSGTHKFVTYIKSDVLELGAAKELKLALAVKRAWNYF